jgi:hypothetical protein
MSGEKYPDTFSDEAKKRIDFILEYKEMKKGSSSFPGGIGNAFKEKYGMAISDLPSRDMFVKEFYDLYTQHCWCETSRILWEKYGMTTNELIVYYRHYPFFDRFTYQHFDGEYIEIACKAREYRLRNLKKPAILGEISENTSCGEFEKLLRTNRELCDYFHNLDDTRENEFVELYTSIRRSKTAEARKEARDYWLEYARTDYAEWEYYNKPCGNVLGSENDTSASD